MKSQDETLNRTAIPTSWISALFKHFQVIYGHKFTTIVDGLESLAVQEWSSALSGLTGDQIKEGLRMCGMRKITNGSEDWPPTPAEFRFMCLPAKLDPIHRDYVSLPKPIIDPAKAEEQIEAMKKILGK